VVGPGVLSFYPASTLPAVFDVVVCNYPHHENPGVPGPKRRPCLVGKTAETFKGKEHPHVALLFGTSNPKFGTRPFDFHVCNMTEMDEAGLFYPTRFDMDKRLWLPWAKEWFPICNGFSTPAIGHLSENCQKSFLALVKRRKERGLK
jgi:hypothetical protein